MIFPLALLINQITETEQMRLTDIPNFTGPIFGCLISGIAIGSMTAILVRRSDKQSNRKVILAVSKGHLLTLVFSLIVTGLTASFPRMRWGGVSTL